MNYSDGLKYLMTLYPNNIKVFTEKSLKVIDIIDSSVIMWDDISHMDLNFYKICMENNIFIIRKKYYYYFIENEKTCRMVDMSNENQIKKMIRVQKLKHLL